MPQRRKQQQSKNTSSEFDMGISFGDIEGPAYSMDINGDFFGNMDTEEDDGSNPRNRAKLVNDAEKDFKAELNEVQKAFKERAAKEEERRQLATDSEFWFCACFQTREQKEEFLRALKFELDEDKYIDGRVLAQRVGVKLKSVDPEFGRVKVDSMWAGMFESIEPTGKRRK